jgi:GxxExxY protein
VSFQNISGIRATNQLWVFGATNWFLFIRDTCLPSVVEKMLHSELSEKIIGAAMRVLNELKPGLDEKIYENALVLELEEIGLPVDQQRRYDVHYKGKPVGLLVPDLIVDGKVVVDAKVVTAFNESHLAQMIGYLEITGMDLGLLINFKNAKLESKRVVR